MNAHIRNAINAGQIKAARALLDWSQEELADASGLSIATIRKTESGQISPRGSTVGRIQKALEDAGLEFLLPNGVRQRPDEVTIYEGDEGIKAFLDDVYRFASTSGEEIVVVCPDEDPFWKIDKGRHSARMTKLGALAQVKCILTDNVENTYCVDYCEYRYISKSYVDSVPFYVYGNKYAIIVFDDKTSHKVTVLQSAAVANAFRRQFHSMWDKAMPLTSGEMKPTSKPKSKTR